MNQVELMLHTPNSAGSRGGVWGGLPALLLFLDQTKKNIRGETPPLPRTLPAYLKVWIQHCLSMGKGDLESQKRPRVSKIICNI